MNCITQDGSFLMLDSRDGLVVVGAVSLGDLVKGPRFEPRTGRGARSGESRAVGPGRRGAIVQFGGALAGLTAARGNSCKRRRTSRGALAGRAHYKGSSLPRTPQPLAGDPGPL